MIRSLQAHGLSQECYLAAVYCKNLQTFLIV